MTSVKKSKNKNIRKTGFLNRTGYSSKRTQFIVVMLIVAVMGGAWFTYRSFAATLQVIETCVPNSCLDAKTLGVNAFRYKDASKNNIDTYRLSSGGVAHVPKGFNMPSSGATWQVCYTARADRNTSVTVDMGTGLAGGSGPENISTSWQERCSPLSTYTSGTGKYYLVITNNSNVNVYVSQMVLKSDRPAATSPGVPSKN